MNSRKTFLTSAAALVGAGMIAATAMAQQPATPDNPPQDPAAKSTPQQSDDRRPQPRFSQEDRAAFMDARIAAIHAGLKLTPDQEKLWPPVETAARDMARQMQDARNDRGAREANDGPVERMARAAENMTRRGTAMAQLATAARPLYASLSDDQKKRLRVLMRPAGMGRGERAMMDERHADNRMGGHHERHRRWNDWR